MPTCLTVYHSEHWNSLVEAGWMTHTVERFNTPLWTDDIPGRDVCTYWAVMVYPKGRA